ncbi:restriction endonuclease subunit S [Streptomyces sp. WG-D5]
MGGLPEGWAWAELGHVAHTALGKMLDKKNSSGTNPQRYLRNVNVQWGRIDTDDLLTMDIASDELERFTVCQGDLLVCEGGEFGRCAIWHREEPVAFQKALHRIRCGPTVEVRYLRYFLEFAARSGRLDRFATGSTIKHLPQQRLREIPIPIPPLAEQHRIVEALEEQLSRLDAAEGTLKAARRRLDSFLHAAVDEQLAEAKDAPRAQLGQLLREPLRNGHSAKATTDVNGVRTLTLTAVTTGEFSDANTKLTVADRGRVHNLWLEPDDILIQRSNTPELVGTAALYDGERGWAIYPDLLIRVRVASKLLPAYLLLELQSRRGRAYFKSRAKGLSGSMPKVDQATIEGFELAVPDLELQKQIVLDVQDDQDRISRLRAEISSGQRRAASLRSALLRTAFTGDLVPQSPEDEPAAELLARLAAERAAATPRKTATATKPAPDPTPAPTNAVQQEFKL